ncbi:DUF5007 domain-containing protein [Niabella ginsengisoli]|uniref:DUF5007 domain-containing protein n=1 Tax=Niabella ginsengisoli TaxID=522298 RepID=A0ABS9SIT7_9BACT|nr:DUF5007 domain-containing protein [Niabella ginsengisoli]MCH5598278.1 DUF5007 domain-containing protein [Niabella ginsengisoli]
MREYLSPRVTFATDTYNPILGRNLLILTQFSADGSNYPLNFELQNLRHADGSPAPELTSLVTVKDWVEQYSGLETSLAEIEAKRKEVQKPYFTIRPGSGDLVFAAASSSVIRGKPDSDSLYLFDINVSNNTGDSKIFADQKLVPYKEIAYEPFEYNRETRLPLTENFQIYPPGNTTSITVPKQVRLTTSTNLYYTTDSLLQPYMAAVYFRKTGNGNSLTFRFLDKDSIAINPAKFSNTKWNELVHGFNMQMTPAYVKYDVAYPIPLTSLATKYTSGGQAKLLFEYPRRGFGNSLRNGVFGLNFSIHEAGDWEIIFHFKRNLKFEND